MTAASAAEACDLVARLIGSETERNLLGVKAQALLSRNTGAAGAMVAHLVDLLEGP